VGSSVSRVLGGSPSVTRRPSPRRVLRAGRLEAVLDGVDLRFVRWGDVEIARRIYVGVRALDWSTVLPDVLEVEVEERDDRFMVHSRCRHVEDSIGFSWKGRVVATSDGVLTYEMDGEAETDFDYAKVGICIHHPLTTVGRPYHGETPAGAVAGHFAAAIAPQIHVGEVDLPVFPPVVSLTIAQTDSVSIEVSFAGERFELEDQRNWSDASFKSYSLPADLGYRFHASAGERMRDAVRIAVRGEAPAVPASTDGTVVLELGAATGRGLPTIGLCFSGTRAESEELELLQAARPAHLRSDVHLGRAGWPEELDSAGSEARRIGCPLELAIFLADDPERELAALAAELPALPAVTTRVIVLHESEEATRPVWLAAARGQLGPVLPGASFFGGTSANFNELNRNRECVSGADGVAYPLNPQVHAFDDLSLMENIAGQPEAITTLRTFASLPAAVSPIALRLPSPLTDPRHSTQFAAAWTLASVAALSRGGADSLTYFETTGPRGIVDGIPYPVHGVFAGLAGWSDAELVALHTSDALAVAGLACRLGETTALALANLTDEPREVQVRSADGRASDNRRLQPHEVAFIN
jgi:D-apionolactonase